MRSIAGVMLLGACASRVVAVRAPADAATPDAVVVDVPDVVAPRDAAATRDVATIPSVDGELCATDGECPNGQRCSARHRCAVACTPGEGRCVGARTHEACAVDGVTRVRTECPDRVASTGVCRPEGCDIACDEGAYDCDDDVTTGCESRALCGSVMLSGFGGSTGYGPDGQCLHPSNDGSYAGPHAREGDAPVPIDVSAVFPDAFNFFGTPLRAVYVNVNGNITLTRPLATATPSAYPLEAQWMVAPWWADVDTRGGGQPARNNICFVVQPHRFIVTWDRVGRFDRHDDRLNSFQLVLRDPDEVCHPGWADIEFRYARCEWNAGDASGGVSAQAGFDNGDRRNFVALPQSRTPAITDLCRTSNVPGGPLGLYRFQLRSSGACGNI